MIVLFLILRVHFAPLVLSVACCLERKGPHAAMCSRNHSEQKMPRNYFEENNMQITSNNYQINHAERPNTACWIACLGLWLPCLTTSFFPIMSSCLTNIKHCLITLSLPVAQFCPQHTHMALSTVGTSPKMQIDKEAVLRFFRH